MGGFASQVQEPQTSSQSNYQTSGQSSGKMGPVQQAVQQANNQQAPQPVQQQQSGKGIGSNVASYDNQRSDGLDQNAINANPQGFQQWQQQRSQQPPQPMGKGGYTNSATSGQPRMGMQNQYSNTVGQWDNSQIQPVQRQGGKGKGA